MTTISFTVPENTDISKLLGVLKVFEAQDIKTNEELSPEIIQGIEQGWKEIREGKYSKSEDVRKQAQQICES